jgi:CBS domain-containing membrane protein
MIAKMPFMKQTHLHLDIWINAFGAGLTITLIGLLCESLTSSTFQPVLLVSMGASAILIFYRPHGDLSQPWHVFGGHLFAVLFGLMGSQIPNIINELHLIHITGVVIAITLLVTHYLHCVHPPSGGTALFALFSAQQMGSFQLFSLVLLNVSLILTLAFLINFFSPHRRYPLSFYLYLK